MALIIDLNNWHTCQNVIEEEDIIYFLVPYDRNFNLAIVLKHISGRKLNSVSCFIGPYRMPCIDNSDQFGSALIKYINDLRFLESRILKTL